MPFKHTIIHEASYDSWVQQKYHVIDWLSRDMTEQFSTSLLNAIVLEESSYKVHTHLNTAMVKIPETFSKAS